MFENRWKKSNDNDGNGKRPQATARSNGDWRSEQATTSNALEHALQIQSNSSFAGYFE